MLVAVLGSATCIDAQSPSTPVTIETEPTGLRVTVDGVTFTAPQTLSWNPDDNHAIAALTPQGPLMWAEWSDGGEQSHIVVTPASATTFTAKFVVGGA